MILNCMDLKQIEIILKFKGEKETNQYIASGGIIRFEL